jgi:vitamin K-dependent gamma-carboxylase
MSFLYRIAAGQPALAKIGQKSREPVDAASLAVFRIALGLLIVYDAIFKGLHKFSSNNHALFRIPYEGFEWVPSGGAYAGILAGFWLGSAIFVTLGLLYRPAMILATGLTIFAFLQAQEYYLNHYYLLILVCILMCMVPANRAYALDCLWGRTRKQPPTVTRMHMWLLKGQTEIVLLYAGLVKLNSDWLQLEPLRSWLLQRKDDHFFGWVWEYDWVIAAGNYGVIGLHILGAPLLLWKRTRLPVFLLYCAFHISNHFVFDIGIFPWMTIAMSALFFPSDWPRKIFHHKMFRQLGARFGASWVMARRRASPVSDMVAPKGIAMAGHWRAVAFATFACVWLVSQAVFPLRHNLYKGDVAWTYEAHKFSWRMKLIDRWSPGMIAVAYLPEKDLLLVPPMKKLLTERQYRKAVTRPRMAQILAPQLARVIAAAYKVEDVRVHYYYPVGYNNRQATLLIDPKVDMVKAPVNIVPAPWIIKTNDKPLRRREEFSNIHTYPHMREIAAMMTVPEPQTCRRLKNTWVVCKAGDTRHMSQADK